MKLQGIGAIAGQLDRVEAALKAAEKEGFVGPIAGNIPFTGSLDPESSVLDKSIAQLAPLIRQLTRVPGEGAMSDYESRLAAMALPSRSDNPAALRESLAGIRELLNQSQIGYSEMLGEIAPAPTDQQAEDELDKAAGINDPSPDDLPPAGQGGNNPSPWSRPSEVNPQIASGNAANIDDPKARSFVASLINSGVGYATLKASLESRGITPPTMAEFAQVEKWRRDNPGKAYPAGSVNVNNPQELTALQKLAGSTLGAAALGSANAWTLGGLDEIVGGINSVKNGTSYEEERDIAQGAKQAVSDTSPWAYAGGEILGGLTQGGALGRLIANSPRLTSVAASRAGQFGGGAAYGGATGAAEFNDNRFGGALGGAALGLGGAAAGRYIGAPIAERVSRSRSGVANPTLEDRTFNNIPDSVMTNLQDAARLNVPYTLADADPALRTLAGSVSRKSVNARALAEAVYGDRAAGQADRLVDAVDTTLGPITDIDEYSADIMRGANIAAEPYYTRAKGQAAIDDPVVNSIIGTKTGKDALKRAYNLASDERRDPNDLGFILDPGGEVRINDAGRYTRAALGNERDQLTRGSVPGFNGGTVPTAGPVDLVSWLRMQGGLRESGGELGHMGLTNQGRAKTDFAGQETRYGPLIDEDGMSFDDAALAAWEAGYFPGMADRPDVNQFLAALRETHEGTNRRFLPDDMPEVEAFEAARKQRLEGQEARFNGNAYVQDNSVPAGPDVPFAPIDAYGKEVGIPSYQTLHYVRQGFDDILNESRDPITNRLNLNNAGRGVQSLRNDLDAVLKRNPDFRQGDAIYSKGARRRDALQHGFNVLPRNNVPYRDFEKRLNAAREYDADFRQPGDELIPEMQRGYACMLNSFSRNSKSICCNFFSRICIIRKSSWTIIIVKSCGRSRLKDICSTISSNR